jgi:tetratricopeptide (TPR) repeat protein
VSFNGQSVIEETAYRGFDIDRRGATVLLRPGQNRLSVKVCGADQTPMFALRLADESGDPDPRLRVTTDIQASEAAGKNVAAAKDEDLPAHPRRLRGPLTLVEEISENENANADALELATDYLLLTGGDDETVHQARDLARRAVEKRPSIDRHLLLYNLSEDRNAEAEQIEAAAQLSDGQNVDVLLARAAHRRSGPSPHEAFPIYDEILAIDPDNLTALRGRVELYNAAGLRRTALHALEKAYVRRPHSVLLANMVASQRSTLGMTTLAQEAEDRYSARRFDDNSYLTARMELALARRNKGATLHYLSRLVESDPQSLWVLVRQGPSHVAPAS